MSGGLIDKVYIGLDNAPTAFDIKGRILGPNGTNLEYIRSETGVVAVLKGDKYEPLHLALHHARTEAIAAAKSLAMNLIETIKAELVQWSAAQAGGPPPALNVPPPTLATTTAPPIVAPPVSVTVSTPTSIPSSAPPTVMPPVVSAPPPTTPIMTVRQPTVLQLMPQQQYVLNQENGQLIPIVQPGQMSNALTSLPISQQLGTLQQSNFGTQFVDLSSMQPVNVTQLRLSGVPSSMSMLLPNSLMPHVSMSSNDTTTTSSALTTPVVCAAQNISSAHKILYSTDKSGEKTDVKYHIQSSDGVQWTMPGSQTMLIPYQQLQDGSFANLQSQQFVSIAPASSMQTSLPLSAAQFQQLQNSGIMHFNQKPITCSGSLINIISTGQASSPQIISGPTQTKINSQDQRGQKRLSDGSPSQLQLRPIAPAGSHINQDKGQKGDSRSWSGAAGRENTVVSMGTKINGHGTVIHVSSAQQTSVSDGTGMYIRQIDRNAIQIQGSKDPQKQDMTNKIHTSTQNVQMISVPPGMTLLQNPLNINQMQTMLGQPNSQVYMIPANQHNLVQSGLPPGLISQQVLQHGQNVTVMQPNQLGVPNSVQYNVPIMPMNMQQNGQFISGLNLNTQFSAQQLNAALAGQQLNANLAVSGGIPIVQAPGSPMTQIPSSQAQQVQQLLPQGQFITPTSQYAGLQQQYVVQQSAGTLTLPNNPNVQYSIHSTPATNQAANNGSQSNSSENDSNSNTASTNQTYLTTTQENGFTVTQNQNIATQNQTNFAETGTPPASFPSNNQTTTNYSANTETQQTYSVPTTQPPPYNPANGNAQSQSYSSNLQVSQANYSPSSTPAPNYAAPNMAAAQFPPNQGSPYPNASGQNIAYPANQYQYNMQVPNRPWFRPRYASPQGSPYSTTAVPPPSGTPMTVPPPSNFNYWPENS